MQNLVIVESPTKARTLSKYLGDKYQVEASMGHIRDLPKAELGIDTEHNFEPKYIIPKDKTKRVNELKKLAEKAHTLWLATDPDREGEAIAWHLSELLCSSDNSNFIHRVVFHEITEEAIKEAFTKPRDIDLKLVDAQQARRVLDRLVGYKLSPLLWKKVKSGLSAGRVQSVALRLIVEKEQEVKAFKAEEYWSIEAELESSSKNKESRLIAILVEEDGKKLEIKNQQEADTYVKSLEKAKYQISKVVKKEVKRSPYPPFTTSTLQQAASNKLSYSAKKTMSLAQFLYEHGLITYMRTDSVNLSASAIALARDYIEQNIGKAYLPAQPRVYKAKAKLVQEAHEAIRPTNLKLQSEELKIMNGLTRDHVRLYDLIWKRALACQMSDAVMDQTSVDVIASQLSVISGQLSDESQSVISLSETEKQKTDKLDSENRKQKTDNRPTYLLRATGSVIKFNGWLKLYGKNQKSQEDDEQGEEKILPELSEGEVLQLLKLLPEQHFTEPPARFTEASLIKKLEELGIGRPSTYAPIISTIIERYYVERVERKFSPTELGVAVNSFIFKYFPEIVDYDFTASLEMEFDEIAHGKREWKPTIKKFYEPFEAKLEKVEEKAEKVKITTEVIDKKCPKCGKNLQIRFGKFGKFLACSGFPGCKHTESLEEKLNIKCPDCDGDVVMRRTRKGKPFYGCKNWPGCKFASWTKPKNPSLDKAPPKL